MNPQLEAAIWVAFAGLFGLSFLLSGMEAGVFALSRLRIRQQMRAGRRSAKLLYGYLENPENFLWTILVGNTLANFLILSWLIVVLHRRSPEARWLFAMECVGITFLLYAFCDLLPKMLFRTYPNRICMFLARPFRAIHLLLRPLVGVVQWVSGLLLMLRGGKAFTGTLFGNREELRMLIQETGQSLTSDERNMIMRVLDLQSITVMQVMTPIAQATAFSVDTPVSEVITQARQKGLTRFPVWGMRDSQRRVIGLFNLGAVLFHEEFAPGATVANLLRPAVYLDADTRLEVALRRLQRSGERLAIVLGRERQEVGVVSLEDILKVVFGEVAL